MVVRLMARHPSAVPFLVHISNESKHMERFAVRSKVMTLRPDGEHLWRYSLLCVMVQQEQQVAACRRSSRLQEGGC